MRAAACRVTPTSKDERTLLGGGLALPSPFGTFYVPNISQNPVDGIGRWSEADFVTAMTEGHVAVGTHYFPAFPYSSYAKMKLEDVRDLFAYLKTLPQAAGKVRDHDVPFPFNIRRNVGGWKFLFFDDKPFVADASKSAAVEPRRLSRQWPGPLRRMPQPAQRARRHRRRAAIRRRAESRKARAGFPTSRRRACRRGRTRTSPISSKPGKRRKFDSVSAARWTRVIENIVAAQRRRPQGDGGLSEIAAGDRRPETPGKIRRRNRDCCGVKAASAPHAGMRFAGFSQAVQRVC